jgi:hypothetical protein
MAILFGCFFGTLFVLDWWNQLPYPDSVRADHARAIKAALEKYRAKIGHYPVPFTDNALTDLKKELVDKGFIAAIPEDPTWGLTTDKQYRYVSTDGKIYGLLWHLQFPIGKVEAGGRCLTGVGADSAGWWSNAPLCPF